MTNRTAERYRRWFEYEKDSHAKVLASLHAVSPDLRAQPSFQKAVDLMAHIAAARLMWLFRFGVSKEGPSELFPIEVPLEDLATRVADMQAKWSGFLSQLNDAEAQRTFEYQSLDAGRFRNTVEDILTQLFGHSLYHRGQIASLIRSIGAQPAITDFVYWAREPI